MDGRIGGRQRTDARYAWHLWDFDAGLRGDRVTISLRGIGDAVRSAAAGRGLTIAPTRAGARQCARRGTPLHEMPGAPVPRARGTVKLTWRMDERAAEARGQRSRAGAELRPVRRLPGQLCAAAGAGGAARRRPSPLQASTDHVALLAREISETFAWLAGSGRRRKCSSAPRTSATSSPTCAATWTWRRCFFPIAEVHQSTPQWMQCCLRGAIGCSSGPNRIVPSHTPRRRCKRKLVAVRQRSRPSSCATRRR